MNKLEELLIKKFPDIEITTIANLTQKVATISKVRIGKKEDRTYTDYDEISLNNIDEFGYIYVPDTDKQLEPASSKSIKRQALNHEDLVMLLRGKIGKIGMIGDNYKRTIVGNTSMIRIQFNDEQKENFNPLYVMEYLKLPFVKEYIDTFIPSSGSPNRKILNSEVIANLPIPVLTHDKYKIFRGYILTKIKMINKAKEIQQTTQKLVESFLEIKNDSLIAAVNHNYDWITDNFTIKELDKIKASLNEISQKNYIPPMWEEDLCDCNNDDSSEEESDKKDSDVIQLKFDF